MAENTAPESAEGTEDLAKRSKRKMLILIIGGVLLLVGVGGGAAFFLMSGHSSEKKDALAAEAEGKSEHGEAKEEKKSEHGAEKKEEKKSEHGDAKDEKKSEHGEAKEEKKSGHGEAKDEKKSEHGETKEEKKSDSEGESDVDFGETFPMKPFHINLGNPLENRYIRLEVSLEFRNGAAQKKEIEARLPQLRDAIISVASRKTREFLLGPDGKDQLRLELLNRINQYMDRKIEAVYIVDILIE